MAELKFSTDKFPVAVQTIERGMTEAGKIIMEEPDFAKIIWVLDGNAVYCFNGQENVLEKGDVVIIYPGCGHSFKDCSELACYYIYYDPELPPPLLVASNLELVKDLFPEKKYDLSICAKPRVRTPLSDTGLIENIILRMRYESRRRRKGHYAIVVACFTEIIVYMDRGYSMESETHSQWRLRKAAIYLQDHYSNKISVGKLARVAGMSERNLYRHFREAYGIGPAEYQNRLRVQHATEHLRENELSISEIALQCGFCDSNHFCKVFKQEFEETPREFRKKLHY